MPGVQGTIQKQTHRNRTHAGMLLKIKLQKDGWVCDTRIPTTHILFSFRQKKTINLKRVSVLHSTFPVSSIPRFFFMCSQMKMCFLKKDLRGRRFFLAFLCCLKTYFQIREEKKFEFNFSCGLTEERVHDLFQFETFK